MKILTCASYGASGSSVLTDLIAEYSTVHRMSDAEFRFLHDPDGISDLEFQLIECHNRHNAGRALKRFLRLSKYYGGNCIHKRYERFFDGRYYEYSKKYVAELTDFKAKGWWDYDLLDKGELYVYIKKIQNRILKALPFVKKRILENEDMYFSHPTEEQFLKATKNYIHDLFTVANTENKEFIEVDQIVASQNIDRYLRYFKDPIEVFVIDRDPRDMYLLEKLYYGSENKDSAEMFCEKFLYVRNSGNKSKCSSNHIHYLQFEDFIFNYEKIVKIVEETTGLKEEDHVNRFEYFNPRKSVHNTQVWLEHPELKQDILYIENTLSQYLYNFEKYKDVPIIGKDVKNVAKF